MSKTFRRFCFTINNYTDHERIIRELCTGIKSIDVVHGEHADDGGDNGNPGTVCEGVPLSKVDIAYCCYQREIGESGTPHIQGYVRYKSPVRCAKAIREFVGAHVTPCTGTEEENIAYCSKVGDGTVPNSFVEYGVRAAAGQRNDLVGFADAIKGGKRGRELFELHPTEFIKYTGGANFITKYYERGRDFKTVVRWYWGATGTGKSRSAFTEFPEAYFKDPVTKWWDGYDSSNPGHGTVVIDDYRRDFSTFATLLRLFDRYPVRVEPKNGSVMFLAKVLIVTAPLPPDLMWRGRTAEDIGQLMRRIDIVKAFINIDGESVDIADARYLRLWSEAEQRVAEAEREKNCTTRN